MPAKSGSQAEFLDGAALAAQELGRRDLPRLLQRAWQAEPSLTRLLRWLGSTRTKASLKKRVAAAREVCPSKARCQRAFLDILAGDLVSAAEYLAKAPGLGWSEREHPGHMLFPLFCHMLGANGEEPGFYGGLREHHAVEYERPYGSDRDREAPQLRRPSTGDVLAIAKLATVTEPATRAAMLKAMRWAANKRLAGVTRHQRRRHYGHAASLALACLALDDSEASRRWFTATRGRYSRYSALQREFERLGASKGWIAELKQRSS